MKSFIFNFKYCFFNLMYNLGWRFKCHHHTIKCPWCGGDIWPGDRITLSGPTNPTNFKIPDGVIVYSTRPLQLVGCPRKCCAKSGADYSGKWTGKKVELFESALEK